MVNYDTPRQYLNFNQTDFWCSSSFDVTWPHGVPPSANEFCLLQAVDWQFRTGLTDVLLWQCVTCVQEDRKIRVIARNIGNAN